MGRARDMETKTESPGRFKLKRRSDISKLSAKRVFSGPQDVSEAHIFAIPHDVIGTPVVVKEIRVDSGVEAGLRVGEVERQSFAQGDDRRVDGLYREAIRALSVF